MKTEKLMLDKYFKIKRQYDKLKAEKAEIENYFKDKIEGKKIIDRYDINVFEVCRSNLDKEKLTNDMGLRFIDKYLSFNKYKAIKIQKI